MIEARNIDAPDGSTRLRASIARMRKAADIFPGPARAAEALAANFERWRERRFPTRRAAISQIASRSDWSERLLDESFDALVAPFSRDALLSFASAIRPRFRVGGFIMPANVPGAGMHELVTGLISGAAAILKTSVREPVFFPAFAQTLGANDPAIGAMLEVISFSSERADLVRVLSEDCDFVVALGEDATIARLSAARRLFGFGSKTSGALISLAEPANLSALAYSVARDAILFEQNGCLSPHHIFVADTDRSRARDFARSVAEAMALLAATLPPAQLSFDTAASIRRLRERARWRHIGGQDVELFEEDPMASTVVFDPSARFALSPGYRCLTISTVSGADDLAFRLAPLAGRVEGFALTASRDARARFVDVLAGAGVTYICDPGKMQSPPLNWPHGGGAFLDFLAAPDE